MSTTLIQRSSSSQSRLGPKRTERRLYAVGILALAVHLLITALAGPATSLVGVGLIGALAAAALAPYSRLRRRTRVAWSGALGLVVTGTLGSSDALGLMARRATPAG